MIQKSRLYQQVSSTCIHINICTAYHDKKSMVGYTCIPNSDTRGHLISACYWSIDIYAALHYTDVAQVIKLPYLKEHHPK